MLLKRICAIYVVTVLWRGEKCGITELLAQFCQPCLLRANCKKREDSKCDLAPGFYRVGDPDMLDPDSPGVDPEPPRPPQRSSAPVANSTTAFSARHPPPPRATPSTSGFRRSRGPVNVKGNEHYPLECPAFAAASPAPGGDFGSALARALSLRPGVGAPIPDRLSKSKGDPRPRPKVSSVKNRLG